MAPKSSEPKVEIVNVKPLCEILVEFDIEGTAPYVQHAFSQKSKEKMRATQEAGAQAKSRKERAAKDFDEAFRCATHRGPKGEYGIPAPAFRNALIDACRTVGYKMTHAKMAAYVTADFFAEDGTPMVRLNSGDPEMHIAAARNDNGSTDLRARPMWREWKATVRVRADEGMFSISDVTNLMVRAGAQVGVGEGRPFSKNSAGCGWGTYRVASVRASRVES